MSAPIPLRPDLMPSLDVEREMLSFVNEKLREYHAEHGCAPTAIALVLLGADKGDSVSVAWSWSPENENSSRLLTCSAASALLLKRAIMS